jgi:hypothetical protein
MSSIIAINIVAMTNCISIAVAQYNPYNPSTGQSTSSLSPPSTPQSPSLGQSTSSPPPSPPPNEQPTKAPVVNTSSPSPPPNATKAPVVNTSSPSPPPNATKAPVVNSSTISSPPNPVIVGPSNYIASPITSGNQTNVNATSSPPSKGLFLGSSGG